MMRGAEFDEDGTIHARGLLGKSDLEVSIDFDEQQIDTTNDGEPDTVTWFNKRERFVDTSKVLGFKLWEMTVNFGFHQLNDGTDTCEVYHNIEHFSGTQIKAQRITSFGRASTNNSYPLDFYLTLAFQDSSSFD